MIILLIILQSFGTTSSRMSNHSTYKKPCGHGNQPACPIPFSRQNYLIAGGLLLGSRYLYKSFKNATSVSEANVDNIP